MKMIQKYKKEIDAAYPFRTELHAHTAPSSPCSRFCAETLADSLIKEGIHAVALTNHFGPYHMQLFETKEAFIEQYLRDYHDLEIVAKKRGLTVLFGIELRFQENKNDYLVLGLEQSDLSRVYDVVDSGLSRFRADFAEKNILILQAHPDRDGMVHADAAYLDGAEVFNLYSGYNPRTAVTAKWVQKENLPIIVGGSDLHHPGMEGYCLLRTQVCPTDAAELIAILKSGDYALEIGGSIVLP